MKRQTDPGEISPKGEGFVKGLAIDPVIFGFHEAQLKILVVEHGNTNLFALPGGYIRENEDLDAAAQRVLSATTGLPTIYLQQFHTFGAVSRGSTETIRTIMEGQGIDYQPDHWILGRFFSVGYYALVDFTKTVPRPAATADSCRWYDLNNLPPLILDHTQIVAKALSMLQANLESTSSDFIQWGAELLPDTFTMADLQRLYETILNKPLVRTNFQRKMLSSGFLERVDKKRTGAAHKPAFLYRFRKN